MISWVLLPRDCNNIAHIWSSKSLRSKLSYQHKVFDNNTKLNGCLEKVMMVVLALVHSRELFANNLKSELIFFFPKVMAKFCS